MASLRVLGMGIGLVVFVAVVPQLGLVEQEKKHQTGQQQCKQLLRAGLALERLGQQVHERGGQQGARRQTQHVLGVTGEHCKTQQSGQPDTAHTGGHRADQNPEKRHRE